MVRMAALIFALVLAGCATRHPSRNMNDMSASEIERALSGEIQAFTETGTGQ